MLKTLKLVLLFAAMPGAALWGQGGAITLSLTGNANATTAGSNSTFTIGGTGSVTGFGNATLAGAGVYDISTLASLGPITGGFTLIFSNTDVLVGTFSIPPGVLVPLVGNPTGATGSLRIIGGTGKFAGATGSLTGVTGSGTPTNATSTSFQLSGTGTLSTPAVPAPGVLVYAGSIAHVAAGGGWKTTFTFVNPGATAAQFRLAIFDENGAPLSLPLAFPQSPTTSVAQASTIDRTLAPASVLIVETEGGQALQLGSAQVTTDGAVTGSAIFRFTPSGQEAVVPLETRNPTGFVLPFDNTGGLVNGLAIANIGSTATTVAIVINDDLGLSGIVANTLTLPARGHVSFVLAERYVLTAQRRGIITIQALPNAQISVLGIRATTAGAYTSIPPGVK